MNYLGSFVYYLLDYIPILNRIKKQYDFKSLVNNIIKAFKILKDKSINESETLFENEFIKITGKAYLGVKMISDKKPIEIIEYEDKKNQNNKFFDKIMEIYKKLNNIKKNPEIESIKKVIFEFNEKIGDLITNGKLYIFINEERDEIKLIFEINDTYQKTQILGTFELAIKFKKEGLGLKTIKNYSEHISKKIKIEEEKNVDEAIVLYLYFLVMISIDFLIAGEEGVSLFLSWLESIEKNEAFELKNYAYFINQYQLNN